MKYRIYNTFKNKYEDGYKDFALLPNGIICYGGEFKGSLMEVQNDHIYTVELSTGLLDKNGVEIYEGDTGIVDTGIYRSNLEKIVYKQGAYFCGDGLFNKFVANNFEIVGNIHDTPKED
jgi:hypothetical protein